MKSSPVFTTGWYSYTHTLTNHPLMYGGMSVRSELDCRSIEPQQQGYYWTGTLGVLINWEDHDATWFEYYEKSSSRCLQSDNICSTMAASSSPISGRNDRDTSSNPVENRCNT